MKLDDILQLKNTTEVRVTYRDTDQMGNAYYSQFLVWFEIGRTEFIRELGLPYRALEEQGVFLPVRECHCRYYAPALYDDLIRIQTTVIKLSQTSVKFACEVTRAADGQLLARGSTHHPFVNSERKITRAGFESFGIS